MKVVDIFRVSGNRLGVVVPFPEFLPVPEDPNLARLVHEDGRTWNILGVERYGNAKRTLPSRTHLTLLLELPPGDAGPKKDDPVTLRWTRPWR